MVILRQLCTSVSGINYSLALALLSEECDDFINALAKAVLPLVLVRLNICSER